jgi:hypothetical protein
VSPYERIINLIEEDILYTVTDLAKLTEKAGFFISRDQIYRAAYFGNIPYTQFGGANKRIEIEGAFFLDYIKIKLGKSEKSCKIEK